MTPAVFGSSAEGENRVLEHGALENGAQQSALLGRTIADVERHLILMTLDHYLGNRTHAAKLLGISVRTLRNKLNEYALAGIAVPQPGQTRPGP